MGNAVGNDHAACQGTMSQKATEASHGTTLHLKVRNAATLIVETHDLVILRRLTANEYIVPVGRKSRRMQW